jgi:4-amino-4-deoxy-L-arabinose transferase-like glycosyltransferase
MDACDGRLDAKPGWRNGSKAVWCLLALVFLIRAVHPSQPIVENYVGRQVPTAMVARNLERGSGFFYPQLDTAPFPNYFVVEPPIYEAMVVALKRALGWRIEASGRIVSALATTLAAWGIFELARRREGVTAAFWALAAFGVLPLVIRYGRAFQPDALMLGTVVAGLAAWDRYQSAGRRAWLAAGWILLAVGFAVKITAVFVLVPLLLAIARPRRVVDVCLACSTVLPALLWYTWALHLIDASAGSRAAADNRSIWLAIVGPASLFRIETIRFAGWTLVIRAFTPLGAGLALGGFCWRTAKPDRPERLWWLWGISLCVTMALLAEKLHHEYYWLLLAPLAAVGIGRMLERIENYHKLGAVLLAAILGVLCVVTARTTWRTPPEWTAIEQAAQYVAARVPGDAWVVAPEALLFQSDRRGCRMEWSNTAAARAAGEWSPGAAVDDPHALLEYYGRHGARYFADLGRRGTDPRREGLHDFVRRRYKVLVDTHEVIIAELADLEVRWHAN